MLTIERIFFILSRAQRVHTELGGQVNFDVQDKKHAIFLLQGGAITAACSAVKFHIEGFFVPRAQQKRMLDEILDLILFFDEITDGSRQIRSWFTGHVVAREPGNTGNLSLEERAKRYFMTPDQVTQIDQLRETLIFELSKYMHPTLQAMRTNMSRSAHTFDYHHRTTSAAARATMSTDAFGSMYIVPVIHSLLLPSRVLNPTVKQFDELRSYDKEIQLGV